MATHLVTVIAPRKRIDLVLPGSAPMRELIPEVVGVAVDYQHRDPSARWALSLMGSAPLGPDDTLDKAKVLDGAILYLRDMAQAVIPDRVPVQPAIKPPPPKTVPYGVIKPDAEGRTTSPHRNLGRKSAYRWDTEPSVATVSTLASVALLLAVWFVVTLGGNGAILLGVLFAVAVLASFLFSVWWMGWGEWMSRVPGFKFLGRFAPPRGLSSG